MSLSDCFVLNSRLASLQLLYLVQHFAASCFKLATRATLASERSSLQQTQQRAAMTSVRLARSDAVRAGLVVGLHDLCSLQEAATHNSGTSKEFVNVTWVAPNAGVGRVTFRCETPHSMAKH